MNERHTTRAANGTGVLLSLSAIVMSIVLGSLWFAPESTSAGLVADVNGFTILSNEVSNEEIVCVLDSRQEQLMVYRLDGRDGIQLLQRVSVSQMFNDARIKATGRK
jgi:hypothetical protein